jgi:hypothetical protein
MAERKERKLNWLERNLPEGLVVDAAWLTRRGYSTSLRSQYVSAGWLEQPTRGVYRRPRGSLSWQQVVISLQALLEFPVVVGGRTALELQGYAHYLRQQAKEVLLYGPKRPPKWVNELQLAAHFAYRNDGALFRNAAVTRSPANLNWTPGSSAGHESSSHALTVQSWGQWDWPLTLSSPERAVLELLDELPNHESFHQADMLMGGLANLRPQRLQNLLEDCRSVKVKRLFFFFADRHRHAWLKRLEKDTISLGEGKRMLVKGGKLNKAYQITVPGDLDAVR